MTDLAVLRRTCAWFERHWQDFLARNQIRVPQDLPTIEKAMFFASILSEQKEFTKDSPLVVLLSEGEHLMEGNVTDEDGHVHETFMEITCENISFIGQGSNKTTVCGGFGVRNKKNVTLKNLTLTNPNEFGLLVHGKEALVELLDVTFQKCLDAGMVLLFGASVTVTQCEFSENGAIGAVPWNGVCLAEGAQGIFTDCTFHHHGIHAILAHGEGTVVEIHGEQTEIHHNNVAGLAAVNSAIINIYIPLRLLTAVVHDNEYRDLVTAVGGKIQSQLSSSSLELTVIHRDGQSV